MSPSDKPITPKLFFLNEQHELSHEEKAGGGGLPKLAPIDWTKKGETLWRSLDNTRGALQASRDPSRVSHYFMAAVPEPTIRKISKDIKKHPDGYWDEQTDFSSSHALDLHRLGLDLIDVDPSGKAVVHARPEAMDRLTSTAAKLVDVGAREQNRWLRVAQFSVIPLEMRVDREWLQEVSKRDLTDAVVSLQPLLTKAEAESVLRALAHELQQQLGEGFSRSGTEYSGRFWMRGKLRPKTIEFLATQFHSIQSITGPLSSPLAAKTKKVASPRALSTAPVQIDTSVFPTVAVLDTGVPAQHPVLAQYSRGPSWRHSWAVPPESNSHGSQVASVVVFGEHDPASPPQSDSGKCRFLDVALGCEPSNPDEIDEKSIGEALSGIVSLYPDVRVFNLSIGSVLAVGSYPKNERRERLVNVQDLDNLIFEHDLVAIVAAGNSPPGLVPSLPYPGHVDVEQWQLGTWACSFNALTCGSSADRLMPNCVANGVGWPSQFSRIGPGLNGTPVPDFAAHGGNCQDDYQFRSQQGIAVCAADGIWEDNCGTSFAAPLLAREAAFTLQLLQNFCPPGARPFAATVKAFLALTARPPVDLPPDVQALAARTLGRGRGSAKWIHHPPSESAIVIWQGELVGPKDIAPVQLPIPLSWLNQAKKPVLRIVCAWNTPVFEGASGYWGCREVHVSLRPKEPSGNNFSNSAVARVWMRKD